MAEHTLNTRILLKYDTYANWTANNPVLKAGEVAVATISTGNTQEVNSVTPPQVLLKVGDGTTAYNSLKFVSGMAADVYSWAKAATKPTYAASEITGLSDYISGEIQDTDTQYQVVKVNDYSYKLQSKELNGTWADVAGGTITIPKYDDTAVKSDISDLQTLVGTTAVATQITTAIGKLDKADVAVEGQYVSAVSETDGVITVTRADLPDYTDTYDAKGAAAAVQSNLDAYETSNDAVIAAIKDGASLDSFKDVETALAAKQATGDYATKTEAQGYANAKDTAIAAAQKAGDDAQTYAEGVASDLAAEVTRAKAAESAANSAADAAQADVDALEPKVTTLIGDDTGKSARAIAAEETAKIVAGADTSYDTLKEIADWISSHATDAASMNSQINTNKADIAALDASLATIAKTGNVNDLVQTAGDVLIFDCGSSAI